MIKLPKITKKEAKQADVVTAELKRTFNWSTQHMGIVMGITGAFVLGGIAYSAYGFLNAKKENQYQTMYYGAEKLYLKKKESFDKYNEKDKTGIKPSGDLEKDYGDSVQSLSQVLKEAPKQKAARLAALLLSEMQWTHGKKDEAVATLASVPDSGDLLTVLVRNQQGKYLANKGDCNRAVEVWSSLVKQPKAEFLRNRAKLDMGLCYESLKDLAKAEATFQEVAAADKDSEVSRSAQKYLRLIKSQLRSQQN